MLAMLGAAGIEALIDVRTQPGSQRFPQFESDALRRALNATGMDYHWAGRQFGGQRQARPESAHRALATEEMRGFAKHDVQGCTSVAGDTTPGTGKVEQRRERLPRMSGATMQTDSFRTAIDQLMHLARRTRCALLCAEKLPADCHRTLIADYLTAIGVRVLHLIEPDRTAEHQLNPAARWDGAALIYDRSDQPPLPFGT